MLFQVAKHRQYHGCPLLWIQCGEHWKQWGSSRKCSPVWSAKWCSGNGVTKRGDVPSRSYSMPGLLKSEKWKGKTHILLQAECLLCCPQADFSAGLSSSCSVLCTTFPPLALWGRWGWENARWYPGSFMAEWTIDLPGLVQFPSHYTTLVLLHHPVALY